MPKRAKKILFATDYSASTPHALTYAASLARDTGATLLVAHVSELEQQPVGELFDEDPQPSDEELAELRAIKPPDPRIACEHRLLYGEPAEQIVELADQEHVEAIVIRHARPLAPGPLVGRQRLGEAASYGPLPGHYVPAPAKNSGHDCRRGGRRSGD